MKRLYFLLAALPLMLLPSCNMDEPAPDPADSYICWWDVASYTGTYTRRNLDTNQETTETSHDAPFSTLFSTKWSADAFAIPYLAREEGGQLLVHIGDDGSLWAGNTEYTDPYNGETGTVSVQLRCDFPPTRLYITVTDRGVRPALTSGSGGYRFERVESYALHRTSKGFY